MVGSSEGISSPLFTPFEVENKLLTYLLQSLRSSHFICLHKYKSSSILQTSRYHREEILWSVLPDNNNFEEKY